MYLAMSVGLTWDAKSGGLGGYFQLVVCCVDAGLREGNSD